MSGPRPYAKRDDRAKRELEHARERVIDAAKQVHAHPFDRVYVTALHARTGELLRAEITAQHFFPTGHKRPPRNHVDPRERRLPDR